MRLQVYSRITARQWHAYKNLRFPRQHSYRPFHASANHQVIKPFLLADIGEGIRECEIIQWFVEPEARVEEWDKLCEVQSDKASVEITSRFAGVIKKLHYEAGEMALVGKPLVDIDIQGEIKEEDLDALTEKVEGAEIPSPSPAPSPSSTHVEAAEVQSPEVQTLPSRGTPSPSSGKHANLATPAVRHLIKELNVEITDIQGTGKEGRVTKEDVYQFVKQRDSPPAAAAAAPTPTSAPAATTGPQKETMTQLTPIQMQMFKTMTRSLTIPHFLYADEVDYTNLSSLRKRMNTALAKQASSSPVTKLSYLPFAIKATSLALNSYPVLNARVDTDPASQKPVLVMRSQHNIGVAMDTPQGLLVPVIKNVASLSILDIATELQRLQGLAALGKLSTADLSGGTITLTNIGSIGGTYVAPVIVDREVAIMGLGKVRAVPAFDQEGKVVRRDMCAVSWSADHRVIDGATMARAAEVVKGFLEEPDRMVLHLR
ncbi:2-oxoacid dehydrogenases acyltransferase-domain-containing protein [Xylogone sp. PMI_703]|nr:2-oxoacid dehydrogenases acyltransferase-domain-containing protein [Xylogone sp. PMI_703]